MKNRNSSSVCGWDNCPGPVKDKVNNVMAFLRGTVGKNLVGVYLHGSLAMNCFNPAASDIDLLVVTAQKLTVQQKKDIIANLQSIDDGNPSPEMSIITLESLKNLVYPSPFELHYSQATKDVYTSGRVSWEEQRADTDLPAHFTAVRERGIRLYGKPIKEVFPEVPTEMIIGSLVQDLNWTRQQLGTLPFTYVVLNPCRALAYIKEGKLMSKKEGGQWALHNLPQPYSTLIESALNAYSGANNVTPPREPSRSFLITPLMNLSFWPPRQTQKTYFLRGVISYGRKTNGSQN